MRMYVCWLYVDMYCIILIYMCAVLIFIIHIIGSNEIGIPVQFAKELHYPTPVTSFNAKLMRQLVENGPHSYPGIYTLILFVM